ncbi:aldehyde dehydrogenase (NAD+) [Halarchaeum rubridurum]|uniref:Aldehyde dehydrogenase n=1 Tax=Halarchaeum rubridurum TaxID=489911 RepID=A0A830FYH3_9EURY|nr:aldehyde dehydrogenase family protein [Halarchaeum rubridurum]MBP1954780.1 aldehyde dehydrogenase (NAD+) [Halarchaeum rubridurum]GGM59688.1 aldehyde dehydrogenase [Halarchaeum rubridurum]
MDRDIAEREWSRQYIGGEWTASESGETLAVEDPSTREHRFDVPASTEADVDAAYEAAVAAQPEWEATSPGQRQRIVLDAMDALEESFDDVVGLLTAEGGSSAAKANIETQNTVASMGEAATFPSRMKGEHADSNIPAKENIVERKPEGVVSVITPWNFPLVLTMRAVAPAIATGNSVVLKPASETPVTGGLLVAALFAETDLPDGVLNVVTGRGSAIGDRMAGHPAADVVAFTGSTEVGREVAATAGRNLALPAMELGGNNAHIVAADADVDDAVEAGAFGSFIHSGQICISINRHVVVDDVYDEYVEKLAGMAEHVPTGSAHDPETIVGPIVNERQRETVLGFIEDTLDAGATLEAGGGVHELDGIEDSLVVEPTVLSGVTNDMAAACNEHFGPIAPVIRASDIDEAVEIANDTDYGLSGSVYAGDTGRGREIAKRVETGMIHVNDQPINEEPHMPFGGVGASGIGRFNADEVVHEFTQTKWMSVQHEQRDYGF